MSIPCTIVPLNDRCWLRLIQAFSTSEATHWKERFLVEVPLEQRSIQLFGKEVMQPRLIGWAGDVPYTYSHQTLTPRSMGPVMNELLQLTQELSQHLFNHALLNLYRDGNDSMGMHSDDETELGTQPIVASWSFGTERRFVLAEKSGAQKQTLLLPTGSLLLMEGATQHEFRHGLPKDMKVFSPRLNVTFRRILME
jgi:alkylated DNA repair dioxygenase AlkB